MCCSLWLIMQDHYAFIVLFQKRSRYSGEEVSDNAEEDDTANEEASDANEASDEDARDEEDSDVLDDQALDDSAASQGNVTIPLVRNRFYYDFVTTKLADSNLSISSMQI